MKEWSALQSLDIILPLCPFGPIVYFQCLINGAEIDPWENYVKQSYRNRFEILSSNGKLVLEIPVAGQKGKKISTQDIVTFDQRWHKRHLQSIRTCYGSAPFFIHYFDDLEELYGKEYRLLSDFSWASHTLIQKWLGISAPQVSEAYRQTEHSEILDLRAVMKPSKLEVEQTPYLQTFSDRLSFVPNLSILDLVMHLGPEALGYLKKGPRALSV